MFSLHLTLHRVSTRSYRVDQSTWYRSHPTIFLCTIIFLSPQHHFIIFINKLWRNNNVCEKIEFFGWLFFSFLDDSPEIHSSSSRRKYAYSPTNIVSFYMNTVVFIRTQKYKSVVNNKSYYLKTNKYWRNVNKRKLYIHNREEKDFILF